MLIWLDEWATRCLRGQRQSNLFMVRITSGCYLMDSFHAYLKVLPLDRRQSAPPRLITGRGLVSIEASVHVMSVTLVLLRAAVLLRALVAPGSVDAA